MPPLIGWAAASGRLSLEAGVLYAILFLWQFPHFMAIAWMYRQDYARAGYLVLPFGERRGAFMAWQSLAPALAPGPRLFDATAALCVESCSWHAVPVAVVAFAQPPVDPGTPPAEPSAGLAR